jgi:hypothetical protein
MTTATKKKSSLPPKPKLPAVGALQLDAKSVAQLDKILSPLFRKHGVHESVKKLMTRSQIDSPLAYAHRSTVMAGVDAWDRAKRWNDEKEGIQYNIKKRIADIDELMRLTRELKEFAKKITTQRSSLPKTGDLTRLRRRVTDYSGFEKLSLATEAIEMNFEDLDEVKEDLAERDYGRHDVLTDQFLINLAAVWRNLCGRYPATADSGPFVRFADAAWTMLGWDKYSGRSSLAKKIKELAMQQDWSQLNRLNAVLSRTIR